MEKPLFVPGQYVASDLAHGYIVKWDPAEPDIIHAQTASGEPFLVSVATSCVIPDSFHPRNTTASIVTPPELMPMQPIAEKVEGAKRGK